MMTIEVTPTHSRDSRTVDFNVLQTIKFTKMTIRGDGEIGIDMKPLKITHISKETV